MKSPIFFITYAVANLCLILYGILALIKPDILLGPFLAHVYQFPAEATGAITYLSALYRLIGYFNIVPGMLGLLILHRYWSTRQEWYLKIIIASTILAYIGPIVFDNTAGTIGFFEIVEHILFGWLVSLGFIMVKYQEPVRPLKVPLPLIWGSCLRESCSLAASRNAAGGTHSNPERSEIRI